jgi:uncharacterized protein YcfL
MYIKRNLVNTSLIVAVVVSLSSCATGRTAEKQRYQKLDIAKARVTRPGEVRLDGAIEIVSIDKRYVNEKMQAKLSLKNLTKQALSIEYLIRWYHKDGARMKRGMDRWKKLWIPPGATVMIHTKAPGRGAIDFALDLRMP